MNKWQQLSKKQNPIKSIRKAAQSRPMMGHAIVVKDSFSQKKYWISWGEGGEAEMSFTSGQPLIFLPEYLPIGTEVYLIPPKDTVK